MKNQFLIKTFFKNKAVIIVIHYPNHRVKEYWALPHPEDKTIVHVDDGEYSIDTTTEYFSLKNGVPMFTYQWKERKPLNVLKDTQETYTAQMFQDITSNTFMRQANNITSGKSAVDLTVITLLAVVVGFGVLFYLLQNGGLI